MKRAVAAVLAGLGALALGVLPVQADCIRGDFAGWGSDDWGLSFNAGNYYSLTKQATASGSEMKFNNGSTWWGAGTSAGKNSSIGEARTDGSGNLALAVTSGKWYTFHVTGHGGWGNRQYLVMETQYEPLTFLSVVNDHATAYENDVEVTATCTAGTATAISSEENVYLWYKIGDGAGVITNMTKTGLAARAKIPGQPAGTTVEYFVFTSTMPSNLFTSVTLVSADQYGNDATIDQFGFCMLGLSKDNGANYSYTTVSEDIEYTAGNVWHRPASAEPWSTATMRNPASVADGDFVFLRLGGNPASGADTITSAQLKYKVDSGSWTTRNLKPENVSGSDYPTNTYWTNSLPQDKMTAGAVVKYYFVAEFENSGQYTTTYVGTTNQTDSVAYLLADDAKDHPFQFTVGAAPALPLANHVWHKPDECPAGASTWSTPMRNPYVLSEGVTNVAVFLGNYQADTDGENLTGGSIFYSIDGGAFAEEELVWGSEMRNGDNNGYLKFWKYDIDTTGVTAGQTLRYYFAANVDGHATTYVISDGADGMVRTNAVDPATDSLFTATCGGRVYNLGNCWHIPANAEPAGSYMRNPTHPYASSDVWIYNGNQAAGEGNPGDQDGGVVYYRKAGTTAWSETNMWFDTAIENNKYWHSRIPANAFSATESVEYVIKVTYADHDDTYLGLAAAGDTASSRFGTLEAAAEHPFDFTYAGEAGQEPAFVWHGGNAVKISGTNVQLWVKTGYVQGTNAWADQAQIRYKVVVPAQASSTDRQGVRAIPRKRGARAVDPELTQTVEMRFDHTEEDPSGIGQAMWWVGSVTNTELATAGAKLCYQIAVRRTTDGGGNGTWRLAEYQAGGANDTVFEYTMASSGANKLTVNGLNADYTTSKFFIDESKGESAHLHVVYEAPAEALANTVQIYANVGRRDFWNADIDGNGVPDAIRPPDGYWYTAETTNGYYRAWPMTWDADAGVYTWDQDVDKTGAYRLTARYKVSGNTNWFYYSALGSGIRDHAVVVSPKKVLEQNVYEVNGMTAKASSATLEGHSTFEDLIEGEDSYAEFGIPYLNNIGANCLWFQPIHTSSGYGLKEGYLPGSPYAAKDYFTVSKWYGKSQTTEGALAEFKDFVSACDAGASPGMRTSNITSKVGTINIMLDGVFNHTSWDAVVGEYGRQFLAATNYTRFTNENHEVETITADTAIGKVLPGWYANCSDYGAPATFYYGPEGGRHDIASGPDRGDFGKWLDTAELFYGNYSALVRHNPDDNGNYLNESDQYDYTSMTQETEWLWEYMGGYVPYWLEQTGHNFGNERMGQVDENGTAYDDYGIDGLRCDFGQGLPPQFWEYCINRARAKKWNFMFMAESLDGGKVSYRSNRHFDILNESFVFAARNAGSPSDLLAVTDDKKAAYNGGAVLLNLTSHDEVMPYSDPWKTASRYAMLATVKGLPMTMYGQEQGIVPLVRDSGGVEEGTIVMPGERWTGFAKFELNFGKWVADFKTWNKLTIWEQPAMGDGTSFEASHGMARLYGQINWAREGSPALQSDVQWMLDNTEGHRSGDVWAMAKAEEYGALANGKDAVLAFVLFVNDTHYATSQTFPIPAGAASMLGLEAGESYTARNLAASDPEQVLWTKTTEELTSEGVWVNFTADQNGSAFYDDGAMVYYLKLEKAVPPAEHTITVTVGSNGSVDPDGDVTVEDGDDQWFDITADEGFRIESVLADGVEVAEFDNVSTNYTHIWENVTADGTLEVTFMPQVWTISALAGDHGSVSPEGPVSVQAGTSQEFFVSADDGYRIESLLADGTPVAEFGNDDTSWTYSWPTVSEDGTLEATFTERLVPSEDGVDVPFTWMKAHYPDATYADMQTQVNEVATNGYTVWQSYVANLDPTDPASQLVITNFVVSEGAISAMLQQDRRYCLQYADQLDGTPQWAEPAGTGWWTNDTGSATSHSFTDESGATEAIRFYRIQVDLIR